jgi:hypothetical protein
MTPEERFVASMRLLSCAELASRAREDEDVDAWRRWSAECDRWRQVLRADLLPDPGPQGDA